MGFWDFTNKGKIRVLENKIETLEVNSLYRGSRGVWYPVVTEHFDGEKTPGEMGVIRNLLPNHEALRFRVYEAELKSDIVKIITGKFFKWVVGSGLKLDAKPNLDVLKTEGILEKDLKQFRKDVEARFSIYAKSKHSDYHFMDNLHGKADEAFRTSFLGGDCLCVLRVNKNNDLSMQVIDGQHLSSPVFDGAMVKAVQKRGNTLHKGIEVSANGRHIAFFVLVKEKDGIFSKHKRILARGKKTGRLIAWIVYSDKHRIDHHRGIPKITSILEKVEKLDRYTEAAVGSAEERAKIVFTIEHDKDSDGENPLIGKARQAAGMLNNASPETAGYALGEKTAATIAATTSKQTFNMPIGSKLKALHSTTEIQYDSFSKAVFYFLCAAVDIPPEVALQQYEQNYSSSRAAINGWGYVVNIYRQKFAEKFYQPFYDMWLELEIIKNKITAPGFISALQKNNYMITESYSSAEFTGVNMPHIDPLKEVNAIRKMLGNKTDPLISREKAAELLGVGDWEKNIEKYEQEQEFIPEIDEPVNNQNQQPNNNLDNKKAIPSRTNSQSRRVRLEQLNGNE